MTYATHSTITGTLVIGSITITKFKRFDFTPGETGLTNIAAFGDTTVVMKPLGQIKPGKFTADVFLDKAEYASLFATLNADHTASYTDPAGGVVSWSTGFLKTLSQSQSLSDDVAMYKLEYQANAMETYA